MSYRVDMAPAWGPFALYILRLLHVSSFKNSMSQGPEE